MCKATVYLQINVQGWDILSELKHYFAVSFRMNDGKRGDKPLNRASFQLVMRRGESGRFVSPLLGYNILIV
jgi:hypothetical protein